MRLEEFISPNRAVILEGGSLDTLLEQLADAAAQEFGATTAEALLDALREREAQMPTSTPEGVAFPHALLPQIERTLVVPAVCPGGVSFGGNDHPPATLILAMFGSSSKPWEHVRLLARLARVARTPGAIERLVASSTPEELVHTLMSEDAAHE